MRPIRRSTVRRLIGDQHGFSLSELLVTTTIVGFIMAGLSTTLMTGNSVGVTSRGRAESQQSARAVLLVEEDLRLVGYGYPRALVPITAASPTAVTFWADLTDASTVLSNGVNQNDTTLPVASGAKIAAGNTIYLMNTDLWLTATVSSVSGNTITVPAESITSGFPGGAQVGRPRLVRYCWNGVSACPNPAATPCNTGLGNTVCRDAGDGTGFQPLADGVKTFQLTYFDGTETQIAAANLAANLANIRRVTIAMTAQSGIAPNIGAVSVRSAVRPRNLPFN